MLKMKTIKLIQTDLVTLHYVSQHWMKSLI